MLSAIKYAKGYVNIIIDGYFTERFINLCINNDILLWDIKRLGETRITAKVLPGDFHRLRNAARKTRSRIKISEKKGLPFILFKYRKRKIAVLGVAILIFMLMFFSSHVMGIDIVGNEKIPTEKIVSSLKDFGVYSCAPLKKIDRKIVQNKMMMRFDEISWIGVNIKGSRVYIEVKERLDTKEGVALELPCDLIAKESGIIEELNVREGQSLVKRSEYVEKGDLLVSGAVDSMQTGIRYVHSYGEIYANTQRVVSREYSLEYTEKVLTGKTKKKISLDILGKNINLYFKELPSFELYEKSETTKEYSVFKNLFPSLRVKTAIYKEQNEKNVKKTEKEVFEIAKKEISEEIKNSLSEGTEIKNISAKYEKTKENNILVTVNFELKENIAEERVIDKIDNLNYDINESENNIN